MNYNMCLMNTEMLIVWLLNVFVFLVSYNNKLVNLLRIFGFICIARCSLCNAYLKYEYFYYFNRNHIFQHIHRLYAYI